MSNSKNKTPEMSAYFQSRKPSAIRVAQMIFMERTDGVQAINTAIGNVSLAMHPAMQKRMFSLKAKDSPFRKGAVKYTTSIGVEETNKAFLNIIASSGFDSKGLFTQITNGASQAMELMILGVCGPAGKREKPLLVIDPAYTNYEAMGQRIGRRTVSVARSLQKEGKFTLPDIKEIEKTIEKNKPGAMLVIPYDNPSGHFYDHATMVELAKLSVKYNLWMVSDEAYRELYYGKGKMSSIWGLTEREVPGIKGRRISLETASKVWNACGLRIGAIVTDNKEYHEKSVYEMTADLCASAIGQYIFGALAHVSHQNLRKWYRKQRKYYQKMMSGLTAKLRKILPGVIVSSPDSSIYSVVDVREIVKPGFEAADFVMYCAKKGEVNLRGSQMTLLVSPMAGFYSVKKGQRNPGKTQMRIAYVETPENMEKVPRLFKELLEQYEAKRS